MATELSPRTNPEPKEKGNLSSRVVFQPGIHSGESEAIERVKQGDLSAHIWNKEVGERMRTYETGAIGIDGLNPKIVQPGGEAEYSFHDKAMIWAWLPDSPARLNKKGELFVVAGDINYSSFGEKLVGQESVRNNSVVSDLAKEIQAQRDNYFESNDIDNRVTAGVAVAALGLGAVLTSIPDSQKKISRRKILGWSLVALGVMPAGMVFGRVASTFAGEVKSEDLKETLLDLATITKKRLFPDTWVDGRTALENAKTGDALDLPIVKKASIGTSLMGSGHSHRAKEFLSSQSDRMNAIQDLGASMISVIDDINVKYNIGPRALMVNNFLDLMASYDLISVQSPGLKYTDQPESIIGSFVQNTGLQYKSPEVVAALKPLRV